MKLQILIDGTQYEVEVDDSEAISSAVPPSPPPARETIQSTVVPTAAKPFAPSEGEESIDESKVCRSPVAGLVVEVKVQAGAILCTDDLILVLEAMKMETRICAPAAGTLKSVRVAPGEAVKVNQILADFL